MTLVAGEMRLNLPTKLQLKFYFCPITHFINKSESRKFRDKNVEKLGGEVWGVGLFMGKPEAKEHIEDMGLVDSRE